MTDEFIGVRVQRMPMSDQVLVLASLVSARSQRVGFTSAAVAQLFDATGLPSPGRVANTLVSLRKSGYVTPATAHGVWRVSPLGQQRVSELVGNEADALIADSVGAGATLANELHPLVPASLAPPSLLRPVAEFVGAMPPELNVFGMTRFPEEGPRPAADPVHRALADVGAALARHQLRFLLASQRALIPELWGNVAAHMWASNYGLAIFEDRTGAGLNYNLVIEVGAMLMTGRRCLLLKDKSIEKMPTDLVGFIYKPVDLDDSRSVSSAVHEWVREDLGLGACGDCIE